MYTYVKCTVCTVYTYVKCSLHCADRHLYVKCTRKCSLVCTVCPALPIGRPGYPQSNHCLRLLLQYFNEISAPLVQSIIESKYQYSSDVELEQNHIKYLMKKRKQEQQNDDAMNLRPPDTLKRAMELAKEKGSSSWLTALPLESHGFALHKSSFRDALCLRYGWQPERLPTRCDCGDAFTVDHALNCLRGAFPTIRHNEVRDFTGQLLTEVCHDVCIEPVLQPLEGERLDLASSIRDDNARTDIRARGFWGCSHQCAFLDKKVFNPNAQSIRSSP